MSQSAQDRHGAGWDVMRCTTVCELLWSAAQLVLYASSCALIEEYNLLPGIHLWAQGDQHTWHIRG